MGTSDDSRHPPWQDGILTIWKNFLPKVPHPTEKQSAFVGPPSSAKIYKRKICFLFKHILIRLGKSDRSSNGVRSWRGVTANGSEFVFYGMIAGNDRSKSGICMIWVFGKIKFEFFGSIMHGIRGFGSRCQFFTLIGLRPPFNHPPTLGSNSISVSTTEFNNETSKGS